VRGDFFCEALNEGFFSERRRRRLYAQRFILKTAVALRR
jgi:hypothetical protein